MKPFCTSSCFPSTAHRQALLHLCLLYTVDNTCTHTDRHTQWLTNTASWPWMTAETFPGGAKVLHLPTPSSSSWRIDSCGPLRWLSTVSTFLRTLPHLSPAGWGSLADLLYPCPPGMPRRSSPVRTRAMTSLWLQATPPSTNSFYSVYFSTFRFSYDNFHISTATYINCHTTCLNQKFFLSSNQQHQCIDCWCKIEKSYVTVTNHSATSGISESGGCRQKMWYAASHSSHISALSGSRLSPHTEHEQCLHRRLGLSWQWSQSALFSPVSLYTDIHRNTIH